MGHDTNTDCSSVFSNSEKQDSTWKGEEACAEVKKDQKKYKCTYDECNAAFCRPSRLTRHVRTHTGEKPFKCTYPDCDKAYTNSSHLKRHLDVHSTTKTTFKCTQCSLQISNRHNLKRHYERVHSNPKKLTCQECNITFSKKYQLAEHIATHSSAVHKCESCNKSYTDIRKYKRHMATHDDPKKTYPCTVAECGEVFNKWALLCSHLKTKHVIDYKCKECGKVFLSKRHLKIHSQIHLDDREVIPCPYEKCYRLYFFKTNLDNHIRICHLGKKFHCDICDVKLSSKQKLRAHIEVFHLSKKKVKVTKKVQRKKRKDAGIPKKSMVTALVGINVPYEIEKKLLERKTSIVYNESPGTSADDANS